VKTGDEGIDKEKLWDGRTMVVVKEGDEFINLPRNDSMRWTCIK
jgi:hypothetical protein